MPPADFPSSKGENGFGVEGVCVAEAPWSASMSTALFSFKVLPCTDKEYFDAIASLENEGWHYEKVKIGANEIARPELEKDPDIQETLSAGMQVYSPITFFLKSFNVVITRGPKRELFDEVSINEIPNTKESRWRAGKLAAALQKTLGNSSFTAIGNLLGPSVEKHLEAREAALSRLEKITSTILQEMEDVRKRREQEYQEKDRSLEAKLEQRRSELEEAVKRRQQEQDSREAKLNEVERQLDDRAAKHARRQHYKDIKEKFNAWGESFQVTKGTSGLRSSVWWSTIFLMAVFGGLAAWFLFQTIAEQEFSLRAAFIIKQAVFMFLFVSAAYYFIRWNNQWFQRHANEEFRLKRMELDIDRASWFVEMAFEWKEEKGEQIPAELIEKLTQGLFLNSGTDMPVEPTESLAHAILGAARLKMKLGDEIEAEYDSKSMKRFAKSQQGRPGAS